MRERGPLDDLTEPKRDLAKTLPNGKLQCLACAHRCKLAEGARGICKVRFRDGEDLRVPWEYAAGVAVDPIEKKPFFHVLPGAGALSFGMLGCDFHCSFCQNWLSSQTLRDPSASTRAHRVSAVELAEVACERGCRALISTYNEPLITSEWGSEVFAEAKRHGLLTGYVSNGHATPEVLKYLRPVTDLMKIDLKAFRQDSYRAMGGKLDAVTESIDAAWGLGFWVEVVTLIVPGMNDGPAELNDIAKFLAGVSRDIPWHVTAFHPDYRMLDRKRTAFAELKLAWEIGKRHGLRFVYVGNLPGLMDGGEDTECPSCHAKAVTRVGFRVASMSIDERGCCQECGQEIPGVWAT